MRLRVRRLWRTGLLAVIALAGCDRGADSGPWQRVDLWLERPRIADDNLIATTARARRTEIPMGRSEVRNIEKLNPWQRKNTGKLRAGSVRAIEQETGSVLVAAVQLGAKPFMSFVPLADELDPCRLDLGVSVRPPGKPTERLATYRSSAELSPPPDPVVVDLSRYAGRRVDLLLSVDGPPHCRVFWASPAVYSRGREENVHPVEPTTPPNIVLIGVDTLRTDALGVYGRVPSRTPAIDQLAGESDVWLEAYSSFNVTAPSFTSILTGLYGKHHGVYDHATRVPQKLRTLPMLLSDAGYSTAAMLGAQHLVNSGLGDGFDRVLRPRGYVRGVTPMDEAMNWIGLQETPFFCWIHLYDPHTPHTPPGNFALGYGPDGLFGLGKVTSWRPFREPGPRGFAHEGRGGDTELYAAEVGYVDRQIDRLLDFLRSRNLLENTVLVFVADHGENLEEHGLQYAHTGLWDTTTHVPLMIRWPGEHRQGRQIRGLVQTLDLFPTLLKTAGIDPPPSDGEHLVDLERRGGRPAVFAEHAHGKGEMIRRRGFKYITSRENPRIEPGPFLYDLRADPGELENLAGRGLEEERQLAAILVSWRETAVDHETQPLDLSAESVEQLRALGYLR